MQQYLLQIISLLEKKGYKTLNSSSNNVYGRVENNVVYVVVVGSCHNLKADSLKKFNDKITKDLEISYGMQVKLLNVLITPTGIFSENVNKIVTQVSGVWLFTEDYGKLYVFENQPMDFDGLYQSLDKEIITEAHKNSINLRRMFGVVTPILVLFNVCFYIVSSMNLDASGDSIMMYKAALNMEKVINDHQYYRLVTAMFYHFSITHLFSNMVILFALGARIENLIGKVNFILAYLVTGISASMASLISCYFGKGYDYAGGASGACFGLMGIMIVFAFFNKGRVKDISLSNLLILSILTLLNGFISVGVDNSAHIGGLIAGIIIGIILMCFNQKVVKEDSV